MSPREQFMALEDILNDIDALEDEMREYERFVYSLTELFLASCARRVFRHLAMRSLGTGCGAGCSMGTGDEGGRRGLALGCGGR